MGREWHFNIVVMERLTAKLVFVKDFKEMRHKLGRILVGWSIPNRKNRKCKGHEEGTQLACSRNCMEASEAGTEWSMEWSHRYETGKVTRSHRTFYPIINSCLSQWVTRRDTEEIWIDKWQHLIFNNNLIVCYNMNRL